MDGKLDVCWQVRNTSLAAFVVTDDSQASIDTVSTLVDLHVEASRRECLDEQTVTAMSQFILTVVQHPAVLKRAQAEIDAVTAFTTASSYPRGRSYVDLLSSFVRHVDPTAY